MLSCAWISTPPWSTFLAGWHSSRNVCSTSLRLVALGVWTRVEARARSLLGNYVALRRTLVPEVLRSIFSERDTLPSQAQLRALPPPRVEAPCVTLAHCHLRCMSTPLFSVQQSCYTISSELVDEHNCFGPHSTATAAVKLKPEVHVRGHGRTD